MSFRLLKVLFSTIISVSVLLHITSCATLSESECRVANWEIIGLEDGTNGRNTAYIGMHREACAEFNVVPDLEAYRKGHANGLRRFCTEQNGYQQGLDGKKNNNLCPADLASHFQRGFKKGLKLYRMETRITQLKKNIHKNEHHLKSITESSIVKEEELISRNTRKDRRRQLLQEIKKLERESEAILIENDKLHVTLQRLEEDRQRFIYNEGR